MPGFDQLRYEVGADMSSAANDDYSHENLLASSGDKVDDFPDKLQVQFIDCPCIGQPQ